MARDITSVVQLLVDNNVALPYYNAKLEGGAVGDGTTDDTAALTAAVTAASTKGWLFLPPGTYIVSSTLTISSVSNLRISGVPGATIIKSKASTDFNLVAQLTSCSNVVIEGVTIDANQSNRAAALTTVSCGIYLLDCTDCTLRDCTVKNTLGTAAPVSATGFSCAGQFAGTSARNKFVNCLAINCGTSTKPSDGFFCSGDQIIIQGCVAKSCTDTGFVLENTNYSGISGCSALSCGVGAGVTNGTNSDYRDNFISGLIVDGWTATVNGALTLGNLNGTGNLYNTVVSNVVMKNGTGTGPAINVLSTGTGIQDGLFISNAVVEGAGTQCLLLNEGNNILISNCSFTGSGAGSSPIQIQAPVTGCTITGCYIVGAANTTGIAVGAADKIVITNNRIPGGSSMNFGIRCTGGTTNVKTSGNQITQMNIVNIGGDSTTAPRALEDIVTATAVPSSSQEGKWDKGTRINNISGTTGQPSGWVCTTAGVAGTTAVFTALANL